MTTSPKAFGKDVMQRFSDETRTVLEGRTPAAVAHRKAKASELAGILGDGIGAVRGLLMSSLSAKTVVDFEGQLMGILKRLKDPIAR
jgi:hypothetical protein